MKSPRTVTMEEKNRRLSICATCDDYGTERCKQIDEGCRTTFRAVLNSASGKCPRNKWIPLPKHFNLQFWPGITTRNLIYHVCPLEENDVWRLNVRQLCRRLHIFNGRKIVAVATGEHLRPISSVQREFEGEEIEYLELPNDRRLREVATFLPLLRAIRSTDVEEATFYAHTKGNSTADNALGAEMWRNAMYHHLLDHWQVCMGLLETHPCVGTHKMHWLPGYPPYPSQLRHGNWMFAGTFFWFRHKDVFNHPKWNYVPDDRYGAEAWLSGLFEVKDAASVFQPWPVNEYPTPSPYDPAIYLWPIRDF
jgi:hypothetical protein